jgi:hypothetical protein
MNGGNPDIPLHRGRQVGKLWLLSDVDAVDAGPRDYFLKGMISPNEMSAIYGEPGCGKSFLALYISRAIAQSREIFGKRVHATNILFMALEGVSGFEKRLKAHILAHGESEYFTYIAQPVNLFSDPAAKEDVIAAIKTCEAGILFIDTLARAMSGGSENDPADMGKFIQTLDAIRLATGVHICVIHHSGKDAARGMRGHSSLLGAVDLSVEVKRDPDTGARIAIVNKAKDDPDGARYPFKLITRHGRRRGWRPHHHLRRGGGGHQRPSQAREDRQDVRNRSALDGSNLRVICPRRGHNSNVPHEDNDNPSAVCNAGHVT